MNIYRISKICKLIFDNFCVLKSVICHLGTHFLGTNRQYGAHNLAQKHIVKKKIVSLKLINQF